MSSASAKQLGRGWRRAVAVSARLAHLYLSMASFTLLLFFAATGLTLNHPGWFAHQQRTVEHRGTLGPALAAGPAPDKLRIVEWLRLHEHLHGAASEVRIDEAEISVSFRAPGYTADAFIERPSGQYQLTVVESGLVAVMNDLHKGRDAGPAWALFLDISACLLLLVSLSGLLLLWFVYKRRASGFVLAAAVTLLFFALWRYAVR